MNPHSPKLITSILLLVLGLLCLGPLMAVTQADKDAAANPQKLAQQMLARPAGGDGIRYISGTTPVTSLNTITITPLTDTVFTTLTPAAGFTATGMTGVSFPAGIPIFGRFTAITLTSGSVMVNESTPP